MFVSIVFHPDSYRELHLPDGRQVQHPHNHSVYDKILNQGCFILQPYADKVKFFVLNEM